MRLVDVETEEEPEVIDFAAEFGAAQPLERYCLLCGSRGSARLCGRCGAERIVESGGGW
jgi:hypothetical protein